MAWTSAVGYIDDLVKEFLVFRGFTSALRAFEAELRTEKEKGFRPDRIVDYMMSLVVANDLFGIRELWSHLNARIFCRLDAAQASVAVRLENSLLKLYVVNCVQTKHTDKTREFFEKMAPDLQGQSEWKDWFSLPFLPNPETNPTFSCYFSRQWQDTFVLSLHNFLAVVFASLSPPRLCDFNTSLSKIKTLKEQNDRLKRILLATHKDGVEDSAKKGQILYPEAQPPDDLMDDFYIIAQEAPSTETQMKSLKNFLRTFTGGSSSSAASSVPDRKSSAPRGSAPQRPRSKSRSSSKARSSTSTGGASQASQGQQQQQQQQQQLGQPQPQHTPVKRIAYSLNVSHLDSSMDTVESETKPKMAYLLLGQEEFSEHRSEVTHCKFSSSGTLIASSDVDGVIKVWSPSPSPSTEATFIAQSSVTALDWVPSSEKHLLYGTRNGVLRLCDKTERRSVKEVTLDPSGVRAVVCSPNGTSCIVACETPESALQIFDLKTLAPVSNLTETTQTCDVTACVFNHNAQVVLVSGADGKVRIFDLRKRDCISSWSVGTCPILSLSLSTDETMVYALTSEGIFSAWSVYQSGQKILEHSLDDPYFDAVRYPRTAWSKQFALSGDGKHALVCSTNGGVIYSLYGDGMEKALGLKGHKSHATCTDWSSINDCTLPCITADKDGQIRVSMLLSQ